MNEKLEKLALSVRIQPSIYEEWVEPDAAFKLAAKHELEDRRFGNFPYDDDSVETVKDFYTGKDILITGGTGFIGKVLVEKIMRSCPEGGRIFMLIRGRKGLSPQERVEKTLNLPLFKLVMTENPDAAKRLVAVDGDCAVPGLGLSKADRQTLIDNVSIVLHCAACVRFDLTTNSLVFVNVRGTRDVVYLAKDMKKLKALVHVSTAYSNATKDRKTAIPEMVLPQMYDWRTIIAAAECSERRGNPEELDFIFEKLGSKHQNNYTFTKALAEAVVEEEAKYIPAIILRPTVVLSSYEDPFSGWVDNLYGPMSIWDAIGQGILRVHYGIGDVCLDYLPVDLNVKLILAAAWHRGNGFRLSPEPDKVDVINNGTAEIYPHSYTLMDHKKQSLYEVSSHRYIFRYPRFVITNYFWIFWVVTVLSHIPLGILVDLGLRISGRKPLLMRVYRRLYFAQTNLLHFFSSVPFKFELNYQWKLEARLPMSDKGRFSTITYYYPMDYYQSNIRGIIKYVFNEKPYASDESNRKIMYIVDWVQNVLLVILGIWILSSYFRWHSTAA